MATWINREMYPFESHYADVPDGRMHYVDEGEGHPIVMVHGTPTWSFLYRHLIDGLREDYRVIAPDSLGFGLSDKPTDYSYRPVDQARNLAGFLDGLALDDFTLVVHDFGGSIGLAYAIDHPERIRRLILFNTWMWTLQGDFQKRMIGKFLSSPLGRMLCLRFNLEVNQIMPYAYGTRSKLTPEIHSHYRHPSENPMARWAIWIYACELLASGDWYDTLWAKRSTLSNLPVVIIMGYGRPRFRG